MDEMELTRLREKIYNLCVEQVTQGNLMGFYVNTEHLENQLKEFFPKDTEINVELNKRNIEVNCKVNRKINIIKIDSDRLME
ncbi:hypothetical protein [Methanobrevibacter sp.]|uniref:hypothetical protein n=1 Tax=Methanobrevibacter sp. TaxID=66852 RepID=UPI00386987E9